MTRTTFCSLLLAIALQGCATRASGLTSAPVAPLAAGPAVAAAAAKPGPAVAPSVTRHAGPATSASSAARASTAAASASSAAIASTAAAPAVAIPRTYTAPDLKTQAVEALAEAEAAGQPSPFRFGLGTLWTWATGALRREPADVDIAPRGLAPTPGRFWLGMNLPWVDYGGDFGANAWHPAGGVATPAQAAKLDQALDRLHAAGVRRLRWFLFCDGRAGLTFAPDGTPTGLDGFVFADLDAALAAAERHEMQVMFALVDFGFLQKGEVVGGVQVRGHADVFRDADKRAAFMANVVTPIAQRYADDPRILAWDVINEPEWSVFGLGSWKPAQSVAPKELRAFVREATTILHREATQPVTVGSASTRWLELVQGLGLDFYQPHWYDHFEAFAPLGKAVAKLDVDRPVILGEFPTKGSKKTLGAILDTIRGAGYGGGFGWAMLSTDVATDWDAAEPAFRAWLTTNAGIVAP